VTQVNQDFQGAMLEGHQDHQDDQDVLEPPDLLDWEVSKVEQVMQSIYLLKMCRG